jgi:hypothetical protein
VNPRTELEKRYPEADFSVYFHFLSEHKTEKAWNTHDHHICPRKQFPEFAEGFPENLITLTVGDHAHAHELLHVSVPELWAQSKWIASANEGGRKGGSISGRKCKENGIGIFAAGMQSKGGKAGGRKGGLALTREQRQTACSAGGRTKSTARLAALAKARLALHNKIAVR